MTDNSGFDDFYETLPVFGDFVDLTRLDLYQPLPDDWWVAVADIRGSTRAISEGRYRDVNSISAAAMAAVLNACKPLQIPYVFGGDGISVCVPSSCRQAVGNALLAVRQLAQADFNLDLRIGLVPMAVIRQQGSDVLVARFQPHAHFQQAMFYGGGLGWVEGALKKDPVAVNVQISSPDYQPQASFDGFECRWQAVRSHQDETLTIMVQALVDDPQQAALVYQTVIAALEEFCGDVKHYHPLRPDLLRLARSPLALLSESRIRRAFGHAWQRWLHTGVVFLRLLVGRYLMQTDVRDNGWAGYRSRLMANSDFRKCDEVLRMVIAVDTPARQKLEVWLQRAFEEGKLVYGLQISQAALITCLVSDHVHQHVHFLDGDQGGYALAASQLKQQRASLSRGQVRTGATDTD
jgi:hypothetical protein